MSRGMVNGEPIVSQANTDDYRAGHERIFGDRKPQRGRWVVHPETGALVPAEDYVPPAAKCGTGIMADRVHEGTVFDAGDGPEDIGSRRKRRDFMRRHGVEDATDVSKGWLESQKKSRDREQHKARREALTEAFRRAYAAGKIRY